MNKTNAVEKLIYLISSINHKDDVMKKIILVIVLIVLVSTFADAELLKKTTKTIKSTNVAKESKHTEQKDSTTKKGDSSAGSGFSAGYVESLSSGGSGSKKSGSSGLGSLASGFSEGYLDTLSEENGRAQSVKKGSSRCATVEELRRIEQKLDQILAKI